MRTPSLGERARFSPLLRAPDAVPFHRRRSSIPFAAWLTALLALAACQPGADPHADHGPGDPGAHPGEPPPPEPWLHTHFGPSHLLYLEHGPWIAGQRVRLAIHMTALDSGAALDHGGLLVELGPARFAVEGPARPGLFLPEGTLPDAGAHRLRVFWEAAGERQGFDLGPVPVYADEAEARRERPPAAAEAGGLAFPLEQQWLIGLCSAAAGPAELVERLRLPARLRLPEGAEAHLLAPAAGRLVAEDGAPWPVSGQQVAAGQRLLSIEPELLPSDRSQAAALELEIELQRLEAERRLADARLAAEFAERELARQSGLRSEGLSTEPERLAAERDLGRARQELALAEGAARALGGLVDPARRALPLRLPIEAPLAGELLSRGLVPGQTVLAGEPLLEILGPGPLWVEGLLPERELLRISAPPPARVRLPALGGLELEIPAPEEGYLAPQVDPATRCVVLRYGLPEEARLLPGLLADLELELARREAPVCVPSAALLRDQGLASVYVQLSGERFERRFVSLGLDDGQRAEVLAGLAPGERVVVAGAYLLKLAASAPAEMGDGHAH